MEADRVYELYGLKPRSAQLARFREFWPEVPGKSDVDRLTVLAALLGERSADFAYLDVQSSVRGEEDDSEALEDAIDLFGDTSWENEYEERVKDLQACCAKLGGKLPKDAEDDLFRAYKAAFVKACRSLLE